MRTYVTFDKFIHFLLSEVIISAKMATSKNITAGAIWDSEDWKKDSSLKMILKKQYPVPQVRGLIHFTKELSVL